MVSFKELLLLVALMLTPTLPAGLGLLCIVLIGALWLRRLESHRELFLAAATLAAAAIFFSLDWSVAIRNQDPERLETRIEKSYLRLWEELDRAAHSAVTSLAPAPVPPEGRLEAFQSLADVAERGSVGATLYLLDPSGVFVAWAGAGLLHELDPQTLPAGGRDFAASFSAATLFSVEPLPGQSEGWRVVAGRSHSIDQLPFELFGRGPENLRWELVEPGTQVPTGFMAIERCPTRRRWSSSTRTARWPDHRSPRHCPGAIGPGYRLGCFCWRAPASGCGRTAGRLSPMRVRAWRRCTEPGSWPLFSGVHSGYRTRPFHAILPLLLSVHQPCSSDGWPSLRRPLLCCCSSVGGSAPATTVRSSGLG